MNGGDPDSGTSRIVILGTLLASMSWGAYRWSGPGGAEASDVTEFRERAATPERLEPTWPSAHEAAEAFLDALAANDVERLQAMAVTEREFAEVVWPELPSSRPERNVPLDYAWRDLNQKSRNSLRRVVQEHGGRRYALERVDFLGESTSYITFEVHREARLTLIDDEGQLRHWRLFGSMIERGGRWKPFSFVNR